ncbi:cation:proton antiporter [Macrococcus equipercicus]|uniref:Sodium:proton antiporter n=1 Tax=Macrococcus equipercicus TaxID=69967 RepID=A0A9Q9BTU0_9STAP|nr:sodium:proton antiporter [Macrococcus equipercicus]UTH14274.1 sodium:proton antiporter [Macrococcus equipercicus]
MESFIVIISFIVAVIISAVIHHYFSKIPLVFIQIGIGMLIFLTPLPIQLEFEPELFLIGIIAPLLFLEGNHVSRINLLKYLKPVILMAIGLVFTTVIGLGYIIQWMLPVIPFAACFALAAIICPTDAVAVQAIAKGRKLPKGLMTILSGESLLNDAAGILSFNIALVALTTGEFSATHAVLQFVMSTFGGLIVGAIIGVAFVQFRMFLIRTGFYNEFVFILIQLLTPFIIYMTAESFHVSGVIAAVIGGIIHGMERDRLSQATTRLQLGYDNTWGLLSTVLNGFVFTILGYIIPEVTVHMINTESGHLGRIIFYTLLIALFVYIFRFVWVYLLYDRFFIPESRFERILNNESVANVEKRPSRFKYALLASVCGVHGTISMAIALTLPMKVFHDQPFATRDDMLFITAGVVVISLIIAQIVLPLLTTFEERVSVSKLSFREARMMMKEHGLFYIQRNSGPENSVAASSLTHQYATQISFFKEADDNEQSLKELSRLQSIALQTEMETLKELTQTGKITESTFNNYITYTERTRNFASLSFFAKLTFIFRMRKRRTQFMNQVNAASSLSFKNNLLEIEKVAQVVHYKIVERLSGELVKSNKIEMAMVTDSYLNRMIQLKRNATTEDMNNSETLLALEVLNVERDYIHQLVDKEKISSEVAVELRQSINYDEMVMLSSNER